MAHTTEGIIAAYGATVANIMGTGQRGMITVALERIDAGYRNTVTVQGTRSTDRESSLYFANLDEARKTFNVALSGLRVARATFGH